jgi:hypothetical protein
MTKLNQILSALAIGFTTYLAGTASASAISLNLNWTGTGDISGTYSLTGSFTGAKANADDFLRFSDGEISDFTITFRQDPATPLMTYFFSQISTDPLFNFNYQISTNTILQTGGLTSPTGFSIGISSTGGYSLDSGTGSGLFFNDNTIGGLDFARGGTLLATPATAVPFEFDASAGILTMGGAFALRRWYKKRKESSK